MIRERINALQISPAEPNQPAITRSVSRAVQSLRSSLGTVMTRGIMTVADETSHIPGTPAAQAPDLLSPAPLAAVPPSSPEVSAALSAATPPSAPAADWAATSVTVVITD
jgi:hypothetical protein